MKTGGRTAVVVGILVTMTAPSSASPRIRFTDDPGDFLRRAARHLAQRPVTSTVLSTVAERWRASGRAPGSPYDWFCTAEDADGEVVGVAMRTAPFEPHPLYVLDQPAAATRALTRALLERGEPVEKVNGLRPAVDDLAAALAEARGAEVEVEVCYRLFELGTLRPPAVPEGVLRPARADELDLVVEWFRAFHVDADEQAGRAPGHSTEGLGDIADAVAAKIDAGGVHLWEVDGEPRHLTAANPPALGAVRIGPVYTPRAHRGRGYAAAAVAAVSAQQRAAGHRVVLFTDQANPTSNALYARLGFEAVTDTAMLALRPA